MMSLDALAEEIAAQAKAEAKAITDAAKKTAKTVKKEAEAEVADIRDSLMSRAERESAQLSTELVASSRQNNQKRELIAKAAELDATWDAVKAEVGSAKLAGRAKLIKALVAEAKEAGSGMKMLAIFLPAQRRCPLALSAKLLTAECTLPQGAIGCFTMQQGMEEGNPQCVLLPSPQELPLSPLVQ